MLIIPNLSKKTLKQNILLALEAFGGNPIKKKRDTIANNALETIVFGKDTTGNQHNVDAFFSEVQPAKQKWVVSESYRYDINNNTETITTASFDSEDEATRWLHSCVVEKLSKPLNYAVSHEVEMFALELSNLSDDLSRSVLFKYLTDSVYVSGTHTVTVVDATANFESGTLATLPTEFEFQRLKRVINTVESNTHYNSLPDGSIIKQVIEHTKTEPNYFEFAGTIGDSIRVLQIATGHLANPINGVKGIDPETVAILTCTRAFSEAMVEFMQGIVPSATLERCKLITESLR